MDLENILGIRATRIHFRLIHGGYPYDQQSIWLAALPNVYLDSSNSSCSSSPPSTATS